MVEVVPPRVVVGTCLELVITYLVNLEEAGSSQVVGVDSRAILAADKCLEEDSSRAVLVVDIRAIGQLKL